MRKGNLRTLGKTERRDLNHRLATARNGRNMCRHLQPRTEIIHHRRGKRHHRRLARSEKHSKRLNANRKRHGLGTCHQLQRTQKAIGQHHGFLGTDIDLIIGNTQQRQTFSRLKTRNHRRRRWLDHRRFIWRNRKRDTRTADCTFYLGITHKNFNGNLFIGTRTRRHHAIIHHIHHIHADNGIQCGKLHRDKFNDQFTGRRRTIRSRHSHNCRDSRRQRQRRTIHLLLDIKLTSDLHIKSNHRIGGEIHGHNRRI